MGTVPAATAFPPGNCPLCGAGNQCAMVLEQATGQPQPPCWCTQAEFPPALLARVPAAAQRSACICSRCAALAAAAERADAARGGNMAVQADTTGMPRN